MNSTIFKHKITAWDQAKWKLDVHIGKMHCHKPMSLTFSKLNWTREITVNNSRSTATVVCDRKLKGSPKAHAPRPSLSFSVIFCHILSFSAIFRHILSFFVIFCHILSFSSNRKWRGGTWGDLKKKAVWKILIVKKSLVSSERMGD